jgi:hypothetical protein
MFTDTNFSPSDDHKIEAFHHVLYEIDMFLALPITADHPVICNAVTESFLVHTRNLCDFFEKARHKDDIISSDYGFPQSKLGVPPQVDSRFDKSLAHITYSRLCFSDETKKWLLDHFVPRLLPRITAFLDHILSNSSVKIKVDDLQRAKQLNHRAKQLASLK